MHIRVAVIILFALAVAGCTSSPLSTGTVEASFAPPELGVATGEGLRVIAIQPGSAAEKAGIRVGDTLVSVSGIPSETPIDSPNSKDTITLNPSETPIFNGEAVTEPVPIPVATLPLEQTIGTEAVPFTERDQIRQLVNYGVPLRLQVKRNDQEVEITIVPTLRAERLAIPDEAHDYF